MTAKEHLKKVEQLQKQNAELNQAGRDVELENAKLREELQLMTNRKQAMTNAAMQESVAATESAQVIALHDRVRTTMIDSLVQERQDLMSRLMRIDQRLEAMRAPEVTYTPSVFQMYGRQCR